MISMYIPYIIADKKDIIFLRYDAVCGSRLETVEEVKPTKAVFR